jgi:hypothetical protein
MRHPTRQTRATRTRTVDFQTEATSLQLLGDGKACLAWVRAFLLALGFQLKPQATCRGGGCLTRHSPYARGRLGGLTIWRRQGTPWRAVFTVLPHVVLRYRRRRPEVARDALVAPHGGLRLECCAVLYPLSPRALSRRLCALGPQSLVTVLTRGGLPRPVSCLADETPSPGLPNKVERPPIVTGRVRWHLGSTTEASTPAFPQSYQACPRAAVDQEPTSRVRGVVSDGCASMTQSLRPLFPGARIGPCLRHALLKLPQKLVAIASPVRKARRMQCHTLWYRVRRRKHLRVLALGQRLRHFVAHVTAPAGAAHGERVRR